MTATPNNKKNFFEIDESSMRASSVDYVSSLLSSMLVLVALAVLMLGLLFFMRSASPVVDTIELETEKVEGRGDHAAGFERDPDPPTAEEVSQLNEPSMEQSLQLVSEAISNISSVLENVESAATSGDGKGDSRQAGPEGEGDKIVPRFERWDLRFQARDRKNYAAQLDFFKIELGVYGGSSPSVEYASNVATQPIKRNGPSNAEKRLYFISVSEGVLKQYDKQLLQAAGVNLANRTPMKFLPADTEKLLEQAEALYYRDKRGLPIRIADIAKTVFEVRTGKSGKGYEFVVVDQRYRNALKK
jgi:hypothetical protein